MLTVLKGRQLNELGDHLEDNGSMSACYHLNLSAVTSWIDQLRNSPGPTADNAPIPWISKMLQIDHRSRWTAQTLFDHIQEKNLDVETEFAFSGLCCMEDLDTAESVQSSSAEENDKADGRLNAAAKSPSVSLVGNSASHFPVKAAVTGLTPKLSSADTTIRPLRKLSPLRTRSYTTASSKKEAPSSKPPEQVDDLHAGEIQYSQNDQYSIASSDQNANERAIALFDFASENENELSLVEGQVILVQYRHVQGWLVAQDVKTGKTGLVPQNFVRPCKGIEDKRRDANDRSQNAANTQIIYPPTNSEPLTRAKAPAVDSPSQVSSMNTARPLQRDAINIRSDQSALSPQNEGIYLAQKKSRFSWTEGGRLGRRKTGEQKPEIQSIHGEPTAGIANHENLDGPDNLFLASDGIGKSGPKPVRTSLLSDNTAKEISPPYPNPSPSSQVLDLEFSLQKHSQTENLKSLPIARTFSGDDIVSRNDKSDPILSGGLPEPALNSILIENSHPATFSSPTSRPSAVVSSRENTHLEVKKFRISIDDPCHKVLPIAMAKYNITADWREYALYIVHGDTERWLGLYEKPLIIFKQLDSEGKNPMFILRHMSPMKGITSILSSNGEQVVGNQRTTGTQISETNGSGVYLPGGVL
jgi:hypothetical protein